MVKDQLIDEGKDDDDNDDNDNDNDDNDDDDNDDDDEEGTDKRAERLSQLVKEYLDRVTAVECNHIKYFLYLTGMEDSK